MPIEICGNGGDCLEWSYGPVQFLPDCLIVYSRRFSTWPAQDPKWFMAWEEILTFAAEEEKTEYDLMGRTPIPLRRGEVITSNAYCRRFFSDSQWRAFIRRLVKEGMLEYVRKQPLYGGEAPRCIGSWTMTGTSLRARLTCSRSSRRGIVGDG